MSQSSSESSAPQGKYADWVSDGNTGYDQTLTSPGGWLWRYAGNPDSRSLPTRKTLLTSLAIVGILGSTLLIGASTKKATSDFRDALTHPQDNTDPVQELYDRVMLIAEERARNGLSNPGEITVTINPDIRSVRVLNKEVEVKK